MTSDNEPPAGWLTQFRRGVLSGAGLLLLAVSACVVPAFMVWLVPGADSSPASTTVKAGALLALSAARGGVLLNGERVTLAPLLLTALLGWLVSGQARRSESWSAVVGLTVGYGIASGVLASWATLGATRAPTWPSVLAGMAFVVVVGGSSRASDGLSDRLPLRWLRIVRAAGAITCCYLGAAALLVAGSLVWHLSAAVAIQHQLAPGLAGLPVALLGIAAAPNAVLAGVGYLTGPGFTLGTHTQISALTASHGRLPSFPVLAAVPGGDRASWLGLLLVAVAAAVAGLLSVKLLRSDGGWRQRVPELAAAAALAAACLALLTAFSGGGIGRGGLRVIGASWWAVGVGGLVLPLVGSCGWLLIELLRPRSSIAETASSAVPTTPGHDAPTRPGHDAPTTPGRAQAATAAREGVRTARPAAQPPAATRLRAVQPPTEPPTEPPTRPRTSPTTKAPTDQPTGPATDDAAMRSRNAG